MFWTGLFVGFAACLAIGLTAHFIYDRRQRSAFIASLSSAERERLKGFQRVKGDWPEFRDLRTVRFMAWKAAHSCSEPRERLVAPIEGASVLNRFSSLRARS
jgi:hypothetical protein